jgi:hypothetical protein
MSFNGSRGLVLKNLLIQTFGGGGGDSTWVGCLFSMTPAHKDACRRRRIFNVGWVVALKIPAKEEDEIQRWWSGRLEPPPAMFLLNSTWRGTMSVAKGMFQPGGSLRTSSRPTSKHDSPSGWMVGGGGGGEGEGGGGGGDSTLVEWLFSITPLPVGEIEGAAVCRLLQTRVYCLDAETHG